MTEKNRREKEEKRITSLFVCLFVGVLICLRFVRVSRGGQLGRRRNAQSGNRIVELGHFERDESTRRARPR
jgi:hypothetical protein